MIPKGFTPNWLWFAIKQVNYISFLFKARVNCQVVLYFSGKEKPEFKDLTDSPRRELTNSLIKFSATISAGFSMSPWLYGRRLCWAGWNISEKQLHLICWPVCVTIGLLESTQKTE